MCIIDGRKCDYKWMQSYQQKSLSLQNRQWDDRMELVWLTVHVVDYPMLHLDAVYRTKIPEWWEL